MTRPPPWNSSVSPALISTASESACSAVNAGTGSAAAADIAAGFLASNAAGAISARPRSPGTQRERMGEHLVPGSPIVDGCTHRGHHAAASTPNAIGGAMPTSHPP